MAITAADELDGAVLGSWVVSHLPELLPGQRADVVLRGYRLDLDRSPAGSYLLVVRAAPGA